MYLSLPPPPCLLLFIYIYIYITGFRAGAVGTSVACQFRCTHRWRTQDGCATLRATGARCAHVYCFPLPPRGAVFVFMYVLMCVCVNVCMYACVHSYTRTYANFHTCLHTYLRTHLHTYTHTHIRAYRCYTHSCVLLCFATSSCVHLTYIHTYIHTHIQTYMYSLQR